MAVTVASRKRAEAVAAAKKTAKVSKPKGSKASSHRAHPSNYKMVVEAISEMNEKHGSSMKAIKKFILETHDVNMVKQGPMIKAALLRALERGNLTRVKGKGANGSFKLAKSTSKNRTGKPNKLIIVSDQITAQNAAAPVIAENVKLASPEKIKVYLSQSAAPNTKVAIVRPMVRSRTQ